MATLNDAIQLIRQGEREQAQRILEPLLKLDPHNIQAWFWYVETWPSIEKRVKTLEICLKLNPGNLQISKALETLRARFTEAPTNPPPRPAGPPASKAEPPAWAQPSQPTPAASTPKPDLPDWIQKPVQQPPTPAFQPTSAFDFTDDPGSAPAAEPVAGWQQPKGESKPAFDWDELEKASAPAAATAIGAGVASQSFEAGKSRAKTARRSYPFHAVWLTALTNRDVGAYVDLLEDPEAGTGRALEWMAYVGVITGLLTPLYLLINPQFKQVLDMPELSSLRGNLSSTVFLLIFGLIMVISSAIFSVLGMAINAAIQNLIARMFGGTGTYGRTIYALAAYLAPISIVTAVMSMIPFVNCLGIVVSIYSVILNIRALQAAHSMNQGRATAAVLMPTLILLVVCCLLGAVSSSFLGRVFETINNSLPPSY